GLLGLQGPDHDAVLERLQHGLGGGRHCVTSPFKSFRCTDSGPCAQHGSATKKARPRRPVVAGARPTSSRLALYPLECQNGNVSVTPVQGFASHPTTYFATEGPCAPPPSRHCCPTQDKTSWQGSTSRPW